MPFASVRHTLRLFSAQCIRCVRNRGQLSGSEFGEVALRPYRTARVRGICLQGVCEGAFGPIHAKPLIPLLFYIAWPARSKSSGMYLFCHETKNNKKPKGDEKYSLSSTLYKTQPSILLPKLDESSSL